MSWREPSAQAKVTARAAAHRPDAMFASPNYSEFGSPFTNVRPIELGSFAAHDTSGVLQVARPSSEQLVQDQIFSRSEWHLHAGHFDQYGTPNGLGLVWRGREDQIDADASLAIGGRQDERIANE